MTHKEKKEAYEKSYTINFNFKASKSDQAIIEQNAAIFTNGNVSQWCRMAAKNWEPDESMFVQKKIIKEER